MCVNERWPAWVQKAALFTTTTAVFTFLFVSFNTSRTARAPKTEGGIVDGLAQSRHKRSLKASVALAMTLLVVGLAAPADAQDDTAAPDAAAQPQATEETD